MSEMRIKDADGNLVATIIDGVAIRPDGTPWEFKEDSDERKERSRDDDIPAQRTEVRIDQQDPDVSERDSETMAPFGGSQGRGS